MTTKKMEQTKKKKLKWWHYLLILIGISTVISFFTDQTKTTVNEKGETVEKKSSQDSLDMCYYYSKEMLKKGLKDPESFDEVEKRSFFISGYKDGQKDKTYIQVKITYRATNSFGAMLQNSQCFNYDKNLTIVEILECN